MAFDFYPESIATNEVEGQSKYAPPQITQLSKENAKLAEYAYRQFLDLQASLESIFSEIAILLNEEVIAIGGLPPEGSVGGPFVNYSTSYIDPSALMLFDAITGICTARVHAIYRISGNLRLNDAQKDEDYAIQLSTTGSSPSTSIVGNKFWNNKSNIAVIQYSVPLELDIGDTVRQELIMSLGGTVNAGGYGGSFFQVELNNFLG